MKLDQIKRIGVAGSGTMGRGIAQIAAEAGYAVTLYDVSEEIVSRAVSQIAGFVNRAAEKGKVTAEQVQATLSRIQTSFKLDDFAGSHLIVEAAPETLELKQGLFADLSRIVAPDAILATNTSTLSVTQIASAAGHPERVVGMHFFNPPPLMPLVEVIGGEATDPAVVDVTMEVARRMGKSPVRVKDTPGFIVNRVARPFHLESLRMLEQGVADPATLDRLIREGGGFRMGPFELMDLIGLDINFAASQSVYNAYFQEPRFRPSILQARMVASGRLGRKTGRGWYTYDEGKQP